MNVDFGVELAPVDRADLEVIRTWRNDHAVWQWLPQSDLVSEAQNERWFAGLGSSERAYKIMRRVEGVRVPVGLASLQAIDFLNRRAQASLIVPPAYARKGFGKAGVKLLLSHAFLNLGLKQVYGQALDKNPFGPALDALGFRKDGTRRQFVLRDGNLVDLHLYSITVEEWISSLRDSSASSSEAPSLPTSPRQGASGTSSDAIPFVPPKRLGRRGKAKNGSLSPSQTSALGSSNRTNETENPEPPGAA